MTTILPEEPVATDRKSVILSDAERRNLRRKLKESAEVAQNILHPKTQLQRFVAKSKIEAKKAARNMAKATRRNAPAIGAVGIALGALLFLGRKPISRLHGKFRNRNNPPEGENDRTET
jgi:hypothetical protein